MSKEPLEEILNDLPYSIRHSGEIEELKEFAREQAERVQELEELLIQEKYDKNLFNARTEEWIKMKQQNKRYREALEFYADSKNWLPQNEDVLSEITMDYGSIARKALEE